MSEAIDRLERGIQQTAAIVKGVAAEQLRADSPCAGWDVRAVVNHTIGAMTMFRDAIDSGSADVEAIMSADLVGGDPASSFDRAGREVLDRFRRPGVIGGTVNLPFGELPASFGIALLTNDVVVHGWDVARATGQPAAFDDELVAACTAFAISTFADPAMRGDEFATETSVADDASAIDRLAAYLGRTT
jgi:uncharacterized protein (TIGR03086 family)